MCIKFIKHLQQVPQTFAAMFHSVHSLQSPKMSRSRTRPNLQVNEGHCKDSLYQLFVADAPLLDMKSKVGPELANNTKQVTPAHLVSLEKLWRPLIQCGCNQLVLQSTKIRNALFRLVHENSSLIKHGTLPVLIPCLIDDIKAHIMDCAAMMRALKNEGMTGAPRNGHASTVKHKMLGIHMQVLGPILEMMDF